MDFEIRVPTIEDAKGVNALRRMPGVFENILGIPSEQITRTTSWLSEYNPNQHRFVAVTKDKDQNDLVIGIVGLETFSNPRLRHSGSIGIMVHKDYQNKGVGKELIKQVLDIADNWLLLKRVELTVFIDNERAIHLYESFGFKKEGIRKIAAIRNGKLVDDVLMARIKDESNNS